MLLRGWKRENGSDQSKLEQDGEDESRWCLVVQRFSSKSAVNMDGGMEDERLVEDSSQDVASLATELGFSGSLSAWTQLQNDNVIVAGSGASAARGQHVAKTHFSPRDLDSRKLVALNHIECLMTGTYFQKDGVRCEEAMLVRGFLRRPGYTGRIEWFFAAFGLLTTVALPSMRKECRNSRQWHCKDQRLRLCLSIFS